MHAKSLQSCVTLCDPMDSSPPRSFVHGILRARILEWVVIPFSRGSSQPRDQTHISCLLHWQVGSSATWEAHCMPSSVLNVILLPQQLCEGDNVIIHFLQLR